MTTPTPPEKIDFSDESVEAAYRFVTKSIGEVIEAMEKELDWLRDMRDSKSDKLGMVVIALANQYSGAPGFENRWNLREEK
jgi:hypothetical protein